MKSCDSRHSGKRSASVADPEPIVGRVNELMHPAGLDWITPRARSVQEVPIEEETLHGPVGKEEKKA
jgi:hypothetical protein